MTLTVKLLVSRLIENYLLAQAPGPSPYELAKKLKLIGAQRSAPASGAEHSRRRPSARRA